MTQSSENTAPQTQEPAREKSGMWHGARGRKNIFTAVFSGLTLPAIALLAYVNPQGAPDDEEYSAYLKDNFSAEITQAIARPGHRNYVLPENLTAAGARYAEFQKQQTATQNRYSEGTHLASVAEADVSNAHALAQARQIFRQGVDGTGDGSVVLTAVECDTTSHRQTDTTQTYSCQLTRAEVGGFDDTKDGIAACSNMHDDFDVVVNKQTNEIEALHSKGPGLISPINFDDDKTSVDLGDILFRNFAAYATGDMIYYTKLDKPQERDAFLAFSACLTNGPQQ